MMPLTSTVNIEQFVPDHLPNNNADAFDAVIAALKNERVLVSARQTKGQRSSKLGYGFGLLKSLFSSRPPNPNEVLESLRTICQVVNKTLETLGILVPGGKRLSMRANGNSGLLADACFTKETEGPLSPLEVVVPIAALPRNESEKKGKNHLMKRMVTTMNEDPRRLFTYGITIHHDQMTLYRVTRSHMVQSSPFSMTESADVLTRVLLSLVTATDEELGYDPLVTMLPDGSYIYQLPPEGGRSTPLFYQTLELITHYPSTSLGDRNARVWRVKRVVSPTNRERVGGEQDRVLKDLWVDQGARTEADIQEDLFEDISAVAKDENWRKKPIFQDFFERDVESLAEALQGDNFKRYFSCIIAKHVLSPSPDKRRCFFVYESVCTPLHDIATFGEVIDILRQSVTALRLMFCAGWVHRDVSTGNILALKTGSSSSWQVKLSDLEYSRRFPDTNLSGGEQIMGTPYFMACEIHFGKHLFPSDPETVWTKRYPRRPVIHGYQHDLEGIWWIILWFSTMRIDQEDLSREFGRLHFQQPMDDHCIGRRCLLFTDQDHLAGLPTLVDSLPSELLDSNFLDELQRLKYQIHGEYIIRNAEGKQDDISTYSYVISQSFTRFFERLEESRAMWDDLKLSTTAELRHECDVETQPYRAPRKRRADDDEGSDREEEGVRVERKAAEKRKMKDDRPKQDRPRKRARFDASVPEVQTPIRRSGPVTRSMTRAAQNIGPITRAAARRMREAAASKNKTTTTTVRKSRR
ncbi:other/FunK1 protein kinase [Coprinopsis cinerea AmutBmut pab1-1]|nr:other/FunK1 protein kinase [Coprinopsis cinerea AmutBmut pab1-1]